MSAQETKFKVSPERQKVNEIIYQATTAEQ